MTERLRRTIAWWEIVCGFLGFAAFGIPAMDWPSGSRRILVDVVGPVNIFLGILFFAVTIAAGVVLKRGERRGLLWSTVCQALQVVSFSVRNGPMVAVHSGPQIGVVVAPYAFEAKVGFDSQFFLGTQTSGIPWELTINILALVWTVLLIREIRRPAVHPG